MDDEDLKYTIKVLFKAFVSILLEVAEFAAILFVLLVAWLILTGLIYKVFHINVPNLLF